MSYVSSLYHVVFTTYRRQPVINNDNRNVLYKIIACEIARNKCRALIINGTHDHIHILLNLSPEIALSSLMRNVKSKSSVWAKSCGMFPLFDGWEKEYGAFSISNSHKEAVYSYIATPQNHHNVNSLDGEFKRLVMKAGLQLHE